MELAFLHAMQDAIGCPALDTFMSAVTVLGDHGVIWVVIGLFLLLMKKYRRWGFTMLVAVLVAWLFGEQFLKDVIARPRPFVEDPSFVLVIPAPHGYSFPSGHTICAFTAATVLLFSPMRKRWKAVVCVLAVLIAFSRMYLCVHNPTDVLAGAVIGIAFALLAVWVSNKLAARRGPGEPERGK